MKKQRIAGIVTTVVVLLLILLARIVTDAHVSQTREKQRLYTESMSMLNGLVSGLGGKSVPERLNQVRSDEQQAKRAIEDIRGVLDYFESLNVPRIMRSELGEVTAAIGRERDFMDKLERVFAARLEGEFKVAAAEAGEAAGLTNADDGFNKALERFIEHMDECMRPRTKRATVFWL